MRASRPLIIFVAVVSLLALGLKYYKDTHPSPSPAPQTVSVKEIAKEMVDSQSQCRANRGDLWVGVVLLDSLQKQNAIRLSVKKCIHKQTWSFLIPGPASNVNNLIVCPMNPEAKVYVDYPGETGLARYQGVFENVCPQIIVAGEAHITAGVLPQSP